MTSRPRFTSETFKQYRQSLKEEGVWLDRRCGSGHLLWNSSIRGTYVRKKHGKLR